MAYQMAPKSPLLQTFRKGAGKIVKTTDPKIRQRIRAGSCGRLEDG
jgi:hypothetical protein